jgi:hypothetical protein
MNQIVRGSVSQPYLNLSRKIELEEAAAQLETLTELGNAIRQHQRILEQRHDYIGKSKTGFRCADATASVIWGATGITHI